MKATPMELLFSVIDETASILQEEMMYTYLEGLADTGENLFHQDILQTELNDLVKKRLQKKYSEVVLSNFSTEDIRKAYQLAILKGMKGNAQPNHQMTPDSIGYMISYLTKKFIGDRKSISVLDPAVGTGNLLSTVMNMHDEAADIQSYGVDVDELMIKLAYVGANLQQQSTELFHQDALEPLFIDPVDAVVCDLPVGYYPNDERAADYELKSSQGHSYAHHLLIEQSIKHTAPGGYLFFLIPNGLFETAETRKFAPIFKKGSSYSGYFTTAAVDV